jgi:hypothetical protein
MLPVTYPDAQLVVVAYLRALISPTPVGVRVPETRPEQFVTVRRAGGIATVLIDRPRVDLFAWATKDKDAHDLLMSLRRHLAAMPGERGGVRVTRVEEFSGPIPAPDESGQPRWMVTYEIGLRGSS